MPGPLCHVRVLDLSRVLAGPWAGQVLADLGAEVIKIERPGTGDDTREWGPPWLKDKHGRETAESAYFLSANRGKKSVTLDISTAEGQTIARRLAARCDVVLENFKVGALARYGLDYENLKALNPGLVYCSITGFGQDGPYSGYAGYDFMIQGIGGLMSITGEPDDVAGGGPIKAGVAVADLFAGMYAAVAVLAALAHRERTGEGQYIDLALLDCQVAMLANQAMNYLVSGTPPRRLGNAHPNIVPYQTFRTRDGHLILAIGNDRQFGRFCELASRPALAADPRFATNAARVAHRDALIPMIAETMAAHSTGEWLALLEPAGIPCGPINTLDQVFSHPQVVHRGMTVSLPHPCSGIVPLVASPLRLSRTPVEYRRAPPALGQDTGEVLGSLLNMDDEEVAVLRRRGIV